MGIQIAGLESSSIVTAALFAIATLFLVQKVVANQAASKKYKYPPQIPGWPVFGNTFMMPSIRQGMWAREQAMKYGEM